MLCSRWHLCVRKELLFFYGDSAKLLALYNYIIEVLSRAKLRLIWSVSRFTTRAGKYFGVWPTDLNMCACVSKCGTYVDTYVCTSSCPHVCIYVHTYVC